MSKLFAAALLLLLALPGRAQQGFPRYYEYTGLLARADSLGRARQFDAAARTYARAARVEVERAIPVSRAETLYQAARAWARAGRPDSALHQLQAVARLGYAEPDSLRGNPAFRALQQDARWAGLQARIGANAAAARRHAQAYAERTAFQGPPGEVVFNPPKEYLRQFIYNDTLPLVSVNYAGFRLFFRGNSYTAAHLPALKTQLDDAMARIQAVLRIPAYGKGINLLIVDSKQELQQLTGFSVAGGFALAEYDAVFLVNNPARRLQARHEIFHLVSNNVWGLTQSRLLNEGAAVYTDNECGIENPIYGIAAYMLRTGRLLPLTGLVNDFDRTARNQEVASYLQSASLFKYLYEQYGAEKMQQLWKAGFPDFRRIYGFPLSRLEKEWKAVLQKTEPPKQLDWDKLTRQGCG